MATRAFCGVTPFFLLKKFSGSEGKARPKSNKTSYKSKTSEDKKASTIRSSCGVASNFVAMTQLRNKISTFRDLLDFSPCVGSASVNELLIWTLNDLCKRYPTVKQGISRSEIKDVPLHKALKIFCDALKSLGDSWTAEDWMVGRKYDPSMKFEHVVLEQIALAMLEGMIKLARDKLFDESDEEEEMRCYSPKASVFEKTLSESYSDNMASFSGSPATPTSVLPEAWKCEKPSYSPPLLLPLRVQALGKLNPIDVKRLSFHMFPHAQDPRYIVQIEEEHLKLETKLESEVKPDNANKFDQDNQIMGDMEMIDEDDQNCVVVDTPKIAETGLIRIPDDSGRNTVADSKRTLEIPMAHIQNKVETMPFVPLPLPPLSSPELPPIAPPSPPPPPPPTPMSPNNLVAPHPPPNPVASRNTVSPPPPPPLPVTCGNVASPPPPPPAPRNGAPPPMVAVRNGGPPPPPPPMGTVRNGGPPPPPPPMGTSKGQAPLPPPMANGAGPPPPPGLGCLRPKKATTKLKRSSQMGNLYRLLKGKIEGSSLEGKSSGRKGKIGASSGGKQGMADALAEMTKRSAYFQQIEEDVKNHAGAIKEVKTAINSFQTSDMAELLKFHKYVESHLEKLADETQVLARFEEFPGKKLEALRMSAAMFTKLDNIASTLQNWPLVSPVCQLLDKAESYFNKIKVELDALDRTKDEEAKKFQAHKITFDFSILIRIKELMVDVSSNCMELALKEQREARATESGELKPEGKRNKTGKMLWRAFQFAFRVYTFAGGHDDRADKLTRELAHAIETDPDH